VVEFRIRHKDGRYVHTETLPTDLLHDPNVAGIVLNTRDVSERWEFEQRLAHLAFHDPITGLANRSLFRERVQHALERHSRDSELIAVLFLDLDDFKTVNDSLGHAAGDELLREVGARISTCIRSADTGARLGGDEFAVLLEGVDEKSVTDCGDRIMSALDAPFVVDGKQLFVRASLGIAFGDWDRSGPAGTEELLRNADVAMYTAKEKGKGRWQVFEPQMHSAVLRRLELKADLQRAVDGPQFALHYQPIVAMETGALTAVEALLRWEHPERGTIMPAEFIALAEDSGLIVPIGAWVLEQACRDARLIQDKYPQDPPLAISVNLSARQLQRSAIVSEVKHALQASGIDPSSLILEVTETAVMQDLDLSILRLHELKGLGVRLAIDDFGAGHSSLTSLRRFPVDTLKVDKSFVDAISDGGDATALAAAIVHLAATLRLDAVAEGVERAEQSERLLELGCRLGQGYYFAKPVTRQGMEELLASRRIILAA
jgi:diguanylate cyclase (GGDEF)-like protein